jgi:hypothetical protein
MDGDGPLEWASVEALLEGHWYNAVANLLNNALRKSDVEGPLVEARDLAEAARRVMDLDAEDFAGLAQGFDKTWSARLAASSFPDEPREASRGALGSLVPLYQLMLEVLEIRAVRDEPLQVVVIAHLIGEYLIQLAWESTLGHGGDPMRMAAVVGGSRWGTDDPKCAHSSVLRSTARRVLHATQGDQAGFTAYLDGFHSRLGDALGVCAMNHATVNAGERPDVGEMCPNPCDFATRAPLEERRDLDARVRLARIYCDSPILALRHHAPVGHFFGVPSVAEIADAWPDTWHKLTQQWPDGDNPLLKVVPVGRPGDVEALPGLSALISAVAGRPMGPGRVLHAIREDIARALREAQSSEEAQ